MADLSGFDAAQVEPEFGFDPVPAGKYEAVVRASEFKSTKAGTGQYLELAFQIVAGQYKDRLVWSRLNLDNPSTTAVKIAKAELSAICRAVGVLQPRDSTDLHNLPLIIDVRCKKRSDTDEITNEIKGYMAKESHVQPAAATAGSTPPWQRS